MVLGQAGRLKEYRWENIEVGEEFGPIEGVVSDFKLKTHAYAVDDYGDWYFRDSPFGGRIGHPTLLADDVMRVVMLRYDLSSGGGGLQSRAELELVRPIFVGQKVSLRGRHTDKYVKRDQTYRVLEGDALDEAGQLLVRVRVAAMMGARSGGAAEGQRTSAPRPDAITGEVPAGAPLASRASREVPEGAVLPRLTKHVTLEQSIAFSGFSYGWLGDGSSAMRASIHSDGEVARKRGLPDVALQGLVLLAYLSELSTGFFGPLWLTTGRLSVAFTRPVLIRDTITASGMVKRREEAGDRTRLGLDLWCKNQRGELVAVARAEAEVE